MRAISGGSSITLGNEFGFAVIRATAVFPPNFRRDLTFSKLKLTLFP